MTSIKDIARKPERQEILRALLSKSSGFTFGSLSDKLQMKPYILQRHIKELIKASLVLPPTDEQGFYQISSMGRIVLKGLKRSKI